MSKRIRWSKSLTFLWDWFHKYLNMTNGNIKEAMTLMYQTIQTSDYDIDEKIRHSQNLRLLACDLDNRLLHFYFNEQILFEYLKDMELKNFDDIRAVIKEHGVLFNGRMFLKDGSFTTTTIPEIGFSIDLPHKKNGYAFLLHITNDDKIEITCSYDYNKCATIHEYHYLSYLKEKDTKPNIEEVMQLFRLAINTVFYAEHYPELIIDGAPKQLENTEYNGTAFQVETCQIFKEVEERKKQGYIVKPHMRSGYWKFLRSEFYTEEKRGTSIHIGPTMVKGNSATVLTHKKIKDREELTEEKDE